MTKFLLEEAFMLHRRPYRETSFLVELFTLNHGRVSVIAKGVRKSRSSTVGLLQSFTPILVSWQGKSELKNLIAIEGNEQPFVLRGSCLFAGFYLNELIMTLLQKWDAHPKLYHAYKNTLKNLQSDLLEEKYLRSFEKFLLTELGYGLLPDIDTAAQNFKADLYYRFIPDQGLVATEMTTVDDQNPMNNIFFGKHLLAIAKEDWQDEACLKAAKRLTRLLLAPLIGARPLYSRRLFSKAEEEKK